MRLPVPLFFIAAALVKAAVPPPFSWATVPLFFHSTNESGLWNAAALERLALSEGARALKLLAAAAGGR